MSEFGFSFELFELLFELEGLSEFGFSFELFELLFELELFLSLFGFSTLSSDFLIVVSPLSTFSFVSLDIGILPSTVSVNPFFFASLLSTTFTTTDFFSVVFLYLSVADTEISYFPFFLMSKSCLSMVISALLKSLALK